MSCPGNDAWHGKAPTASTSSSRAWSREPPFASPCRNTPPRIQITGSSPTSAAVSRTTISTCAMKPSFYLRDETLGPMVMRVASFFPFQTTYYLNGHSFIEQELSRAKVGFRKNDNAFLAVDDVAALQGAAERLTGRAIGERLDYWTLLLGPKFSKRE